MTEELRKTVRKVLKVKAMFATVDVEPIQGRTIDICSNGLAIAVAQPLPVGQLGKIAFTMFIAGKAYPVNATAKVIHCFFSGNEFKAGLLFTQIDQVSASTIALYFKQA